MRSLKQESSLLLWGFESYSILSDVEKDGGAQRSSRCMDGFRGAMDDCEVRDLGYKGSIFTWQRGLSPGTMIRERLDRFLGCDEWSLIFPCVEVQHFPIHRSDHAPIMLKAGRANEVWME